MRELRDTFIHLLADNLGTSIPVHTMRDDPDDPSASRLKLDAVNISFLNYYLANGANLSTLQVVIDILNDDENTAVDWLEAVWNILKAAFFTKIYDYTTGSPLPTKKSVFWDNNRVAFKEVSGGSYCHYSCVLPLKFTAV